MASSVTKLKPLPADPIIRAMHLQAEATKTMAQATQAQADAIASAVERFGPAADAIHELSLAQQKLCGFLVKNRVKLLASIPVVYTLVQTISPNTAKLMGAFLKAWGVGP